MANFSMSSYSGVGSSSPTVYPTGTNTGSSDLTSTLSITLASVNSSQRKTISISLTQSSGKTAVSPYNIDLPEGVTIVDELGYAWTPSEWDNSSDTGNIHTGIGINDGTHKFIMAYTRDSYHTSVGTSSNCDANDITYKFYWEPTARDVSDLDDWGNSALVIADFEATLNTDTIVASAGSITHYAASVCRAYSCGVVPQGYWDLPSMGYLDIIGRVYRGEVRDALGIAGADSMLSNLFNSSYTWSSNEYPYDGVNYYAWCWSFTSDTATTEFRTDATWVLPIFIIQ